MKCAEKEVACVAEHSDHLSVPCEGEIFTNEISAFTPACIAVYSTQQLCNCLSVSITQRLEP